MQNIDFRTIIKDKMGTQGLKVPQLARLAEVNQQTLYNYFAQRSELTAKNLQKIFELLDIGIN